MVVAYSARGASGFGAAVAMPLLGLVLPLKILVPAWTLVAGVAGVALLGEDRKKIAWPELIRMLPGCFVGIAVGLYVFTQVSGQTLARGLGVFVLLYGFYSLAGTFRSDLKLKLPAGLAAVVGGFGGGMTGATLGTLGSVFFAVYFDAIRLAKEQYRATMTAILFTLTILRGIGYWVVGEFTYDVLVASGLLLVPMLIGLYIGNHFFHYFSDVAFHRTVSCALILSGVALLLVQ